jgi:transposase
MSASEAAKVLGVSRKTYYKWEKRGLAGMLESLCERSSGRPAVGRDPEKEALRKESRKLKKELCRQQRKQRLRSAAESDPKKKA